MSTIHSTVHFESTYEKMFLFFNFLKENVLDEHDSNDVFYFEELNEGAFKITYTTSKSNFTAFADFLFGLRHSSKIISFQGNAIKENHCTDIYTFDNNTFFMQAVKDDKYSQKGKISNSAFEEEDFLKFPIHENEKKLTIQAELFGKQKSFDINISNLNYGVNHQKRPVILINRFNKMDICEICMNRLSCLVSDINCTFKHYNF